MPLKVRNFASQDGWVNPHQQLLYCCDRKAWAASAQKLHTVAASNNRDHIPWSLYNYCLFTPHTIYMGVILRA